MFQDNTDEGLGVWGLRGLEEACLRADWSLGLRLLKQLVSTSRQTCTRMKPPWLDTIETVTLDM